MCLWHSYIPLHCKDWDRDLSSPGQDLKYNFQRSVFFLLSLSPNWYPQKGPASTPLASRKQRPVLNTPPQSWFWGSFSITSSPHLLHHLLASLGPPVLFSGISDLCVPILSWQSLCQGPQISCYTPGCHRTSFSPLKLVGWHPSSGCF